MIMGLIEESDDSSKNTVCHSVFQRRGVGNAMESKGTNKHTLIFVNPRSGTKLAYRHFKTELEPRLTPGEYIVIHTEFSGHCADYVRHEDLTNITEIITVSGDGLIFEVLNGLYRRKDWDEITKIISLGVIPGGTGNALACSLSKETGVPYGKDFGLKGCVENVLNGSESHRKLDLMEVELENENLGKIVSFMGVTIGLIADVDIGTECLRCIGYLRAYLMVAYRILCPKWYRVKLSYLPLERNPDTGLPIPVSPDSFVKMPSIKEDLLPDSWRTETENYYMIYAENLPLLDPLTLMSPDSRMDDGIIWLVLVRAEMPRRDMVDWLLNSEIGKHVGKPGVELIPVRAFRIDPIYPEGYLTIDGENYPFGRVQGQIMPNKVKVMVTKEKQS